MHTRAQRNNNPKFLSTPSARRATNNQPSNSEIEWIISIHALREEGDQRLSYQLHGVYGISIHALREEGDAAAAPGGLLSAVFLSTPSARRATLKHLCNVVDVLIFLSTPSARRATVSIEDAGIDYNISIHALREEGDAALSFPKIGNSVFLSTPSARRATAKTERKPSAFVSLYTSLHKLQRGACKTNRKITPLLVQTAGIPVRSVRENHVRCLFALAGHQKISTLSCANSGCSPTCSTLVW